MVSIIPFPNIRQHISLIHFLAIIQADENRYNGANKCLLWQAFANRGLGVNAANQTDDDTLPEDCANGGGSGGGGGGGGGGPN
jgi:hypothetical protein